MKIQHCLIAMSEYYGQKNQQKRKEEYRVFLYTSQKVNEEMIKKQLFKSLGKAYSQYPVRCLDDDYHLGYDVNRRVSGIESRKPEKNIGFVEYYSDNYTLSYVKAKKRAKEDGQQFIRKQAYYRLRKGEDTEVQWIRKQQQTPIKPYVSPATATFYQYGIRGEEIRKEEISLTKG